MKKKFILYAKAFVTSIMLVITAGCNDFLEVESLTKVSPDVVSGDEKGIMMLLADIYQSMPMEDFNFRVNYGYDIRGWGNGVDAIVMTSHMTDEAIKSAGDQQMYSLGGWNFWSGSGNSRSAYQRNRELNIFEGTIADAKTKGVIGEETYNRLLGEVHFVRAYLYYAMAKRYGGVPIIDKVQDQDYYVDPALLNVPRSTEKDTWTYVLSECDKAAALLPTPVAVNSSDHRATKWAALALKSRAALYAASVAKFWQNAPMLGTAVTQNLVGMAATDANTFYQACLDASEQIIKNSPHKLYKPSPATPAEAAANYQELFLSNNEEVILSRAYMDGTTVANQGHDYDIRYSPAQAQPGFHKFGRYAPTLDIVDLYEDYTDDGTGKSVPISTRTDNNEYMYVTDPNSINVADPYIHYNSLYEPFANKDARLLASVIVPGAQYKGVNIVIQGGLIDQNGTVTAYAVKDAVGKDGKTYYSYGGANGTEYSGFFGLGRSDDANYTPTGFTIRKYLAEFSTVKGVERSSTTSWIDFRLAEIYLNYAEAQVESGLGDAALAAKCINDLRHRAAHTDNISATVASVQKERRVELAFEGKRLWDMYRRREYDKFFSPGMRHALVPMIDLRENTPKYIFVRANLFYDQRSPQTFNIENYYAEIPGTDVSKLVKNPRQE